MKRIHFKQFYLIEILVFILSMVIVVNCVEAKEDEVKITREIKEIQGEISAIGKDYISIVYQREREKGVEYEIWFPLDKDNVRLIHKESLEELKVGDFIRVQYEEITKEYKEKVRSFRKVKTISFIKPAVRKPELLLKGVK
ncbi:MAG: hypothetical protein DRP68_05555 [Candidatus Omnitrophota bacterium]|nr:MAG: hypothetical protein DRP68_05555 [Candidatus Omnitrophota bacterium]RKY37793.1 MAG: hypothetical protein DRP72_02920 [Candidatus Omnitrophota bacterium]